MNKLCTIIKNKIRDTKGTSIGEMLVTVLILLLSTSVVVTTVALGCRLYIRTVSASEANELYSTLQAIISNELTYTTDIRGTVSRTEDIADGKVTTYTVTAFQSQNYGVVGTFGPADAYGKATIGTVEILGGDRSGGSYPHNIGVKITDVTYTLTQTSSQTTGKFSVTLTVGRNGEDLVSQTFTVENANHTVPSPAAAGG